jgi:hypothetical protein
MPEQTSDQPGRDPEHEDQDAGPASQPTGAAARENEAEEQDQDAGPASEPDVDQP